jgi:hypothetical protein
MRASKGSMAIKYTKTAGRRLTRGQMRAFPGWQDEHVEPQRDHEIKFEASVVARVLLLLLCLVSC